MAQTQLLQRQQDPTAQMIEQSGQDVTQSIQREQAMQLTAGYYKTLAKNANTEQEKVANQRKMDLTNSLIDIKQNFGNDPQAAAMALKLQLDGQYGSDHASTMQGMQDLAEISQKAHSDIYPKLAAGGQQQGQGGQDGQQLPSMQNQPGEATVGQLRGAQTAQQSQQARLSALAANYLQNQPGFGAGGQAPAGGTPAPQQGAGGIPSVSDIAGMGPMNESTTVNAGPVSMTNVNPRAQMISSMAREAGGTYASKQFEQAPARAQLANYSSLLSKANQEIVGMGGNQDTELGAKISGNIGGALAHLSPGSSIPAIEHLKFQIGNMLASATEHGRPNLTEVNALGRVIPYFDQSQATQRYLMNSLQTAFTMPGSAPGSDGKYNAQDARTMIDYLAPKAKVAGAGEQFYKNQIARGVDPRVAQQKLDELYQSQGQ